MFGKTTKGKALEAPPMAKTDPKAVEVLRVWATPGGPLQVVLKTTWSDPSTWGLLLVDIARHLAEAYEKEGLSRKETLAKIRQLFDAEWVSPTDTPVDITPNKLMETEIL